jgi:hypothetical protein
MLSREENELICRTGPGTPMGELFRRFWLPVALADNRLRVFRRANTAHLGRGVGQERWLRVGPSEKYAAR